MHKCVFFRYNTLKSDSSSPRTTQRAILNGGMSFFCALWLTRAQRCSVGSIGSGSSPSIFVPVFNSIQLDIIRHCYGIPFLSFALRFSDLLCFVLVCFLCLLRFFISIKDDAGWADNRYVAFGRVSEGMDVVHQIERVKVEGGTNRPKKPVVVEKCGML